MKTKKLKRLNMEVEWYASRVKMPYKAYALGRVCFGSKDEIKKFINEAIEAM